MEIYFGRLHSSTARIRKPSPDYGSGRSIHQNGSFYPVTRNSNSIGRHHCFPKKHMVSTWVTRQYNLGQRHKMDRGILKKPDQTTRNKNQDVDGIPPSNGRTNRKGQSNTRKLSTSICELRSKRLVSTTTVSGIRIQQLVYDSYEDDPILCQLRLSPEIDMAT